MTKAEIEEQTHQTLIEYGMLSIIPVDPGMIANRIGICVSIAAFSERK